MQKKLILSIILLLFISKVSAQRFGSEWLVEGQKYFEFNITENKIHKLDFIVLDSVFPDNGINIQLEDPRKIQIFFRGKEIPIYIHGEGDGEFNLNDYILFYGQTNDGYLDSSLYFDTYKQSNPYHSSYSDSSTYYLTVSKTTNGLRYQKFSDKNYASYKPTEYYFHERLSEFHSRYFQGTPLIVGPSRLYQSEYDGNEGWIDRSFGTREGIGPIRTHSLLTDERHPIIDSIGATFSYKFLGVTDNITANDHRVQVSVSSQILRDTVFDDYARIQESLKIDGKLITANQTLVSFKEVNVPLVYSQSSALAWIKMVYPRNTNLDGSTQKKYLINNTLNPYYIWKEYGNTTHKSPIVFDINNGYMIDAEVKNTNELHLIVPSRNNAEIVILDSTLLTIPIVKAVDMKFPSQMVKAEFLMVSHTALRGDTTRSGALDDYKKYRQARVSASLVYVEDLYRTFSHGIVHPIAIRRYCDYMIENSKGAIEPKFLFLIGRGLETPIARANIYKGQNNIPAIGVPSSDMMYSSGLNGTILEPALATGRLVADTEADVYGYLNKIKEFELESNDLWKKNILHLGGGKDGTQADIIKDALYGIGQVPRNSAFAGNIKTISKSSEGVNDAFLRQRAITDISEGNTLVTFFGHGSTSVLDLDIGDTMDFNNIKRYGFWYFNGCKVGNPNLGTRNGQIYLAEKVIKVRNKGAVAFMGQTNTSELYTLRRQMSIFYNEMFSDSSEENQSIGEILQNTIKKFQNNSHGLSRMHSRQILLQGDPSLRPYNPQFPDYEITPSSLLITPRQTTALSDSFQLGVIIKNKGRYVKDSINAVLIRTYPDKLFKAYDTIRAKSIHFLDTIYFTLKTKDIATRGLNNFEVHINPDILIEESDYANNNASLDINIPGNGVNPILPRRFAIVANLDSVKLIVQSSNLIIKNQQYLIEIDTNHNFNSPWRLKSQPINSGYLGSWKIPLLPNDSTVYYWRARINVDANEGGFWVERSFTNIKKHAPGWDQSHFPQFSPKSKDFPKGLALDTTSRRFKYLETEKLLCLETQRHGFSNMGVHDGSCLTQDLNYGVCMPGLVVMLFHKNKLNLFLRPDLEPKCHWGKFSPPWHPELKNETYQAYYTFNTSLASHQTDFINFINTLEDSTHVAIFSYSTMGTTAWGQPMYDALNKVGSNLVNGVKNNDLSYVCIGRKGWKPGVAKEDTSYNGYCQVDGLIRGKGFEGEFTSEAIGPSLRWDSLIVNYQKNGYDNMKFQVFGIDNNGVSTLLKQDIDKKFTNLRSIDAKVYPYIQLKYESNDFIDNSAPQLKFWRVTYEDVPEGTLNPDFKYVYHRDTVTEGDSFRINLAFSNIFTKNFDSVYVAYRYANRSTGEILKEGNYMAKPLLVDSSIFFTSSLPTQYLSGDYTLLVAFNPGLQPELEYFNNSNLFNFFVKKDIVNPLLDVTFDGKHITNGEIVSSKPRILITSKDENQFLWQKDSSKVYLELLAPGSTSYEKILMSDSRIEFFVATSNENRERIIFKPNKLSDGIYRLRVQTKDASDNNAGAEPYEISFNVINKSSVTNFYPYPNPFTTRMRFVFTLTGEEIPDEIHIKIMTLTGKVVREISKAELGPLRIGNNTTNFAWDGTDQFGDRLANGVYLYHVSVKNAGKVLDSRETKGDNAFKKGFGKIYLLR